MARSVGGVGEALAASAGTVMVGLGLMALAEFAKVRYAGPAIALSLGVALVASLTLTPALLRLFGQARLLARAGPQVAAEVAAPATLTRRQAWLLGLDQPPGRAPGRVVARLVAIAAAAVVIGLHVQANYRATGELSPQSEQPAGAGGDPAPLHRRRDRPASRSCSSPTTTGRAREGQLEIDHLSRGFAVLPNVAEVRSLTQPLGMPMPRPAAGRTDGTADQSCAGRSEPMWPSSAQSMRARPATTSPARCGTKSGGRDPLRHPARRGSKATRSSRRASTR